MGVGSRIKMTTYTLAALALVYVGMNALREETQDQVVFTVTFSPEPRRTGVHVMANVEGVGFFNELPSRSPVIATTWMPKGASATLNAQQVEAGQLSCTAHLNGKLVDGPNPRTEIGSVRCYVNRRTR